MPADGCPMGAQLSVFRRKWPLRYTNRRSDPEVNGGASPTRVVVSKVSMMGEGAPSSGYCNSRDSESAEYQYGENAQQPIRQGIDPAPVGHEDHRKRPHLFSGVPRLGRIRRMGWSREAPSPPKPPALNITLLTPFSFSRDRVFLPRPVGGVPYREGSRWVRTSLPTVISSTPRAFSLTTACSAVSVTVYCLSLQSISTM
jgi:hypothetical protein